jgi:tRNA (guanine37-N1)-methyltransferase
MLFDVATLFPAIFDSFLAESLIGKGLAAEAFRARIIDVRDFTLDKHRTADDRPFGGGPGMVLKPEPLAGAIEFALNGSGDRTRTKVILMTPAGTPLNQAKVRELAELDHLILVCGRYEGVDERVNRLFIDEEISVGDYVLSGGEVPAMVLIEAVARLLPGVLGKLESVEEETFSQGLLEYPQFTRPRVFRDLAAPETLLSGDHGAIRRWRMKESLKRTLGSRPEMLSRIELTPEQKKILREIVLEYDEFELDFPDDED